MNHSARLLIRKLPKKIRLFFAKKYFASLLKQEKLISSEIEWENLNVWLKKGDNCLDIGANIGRYTFKMSRLIGLEGHVFSFEPMTETFSILTHLASVVNSENLTLINAAVGDKSLMVEMKREFLPKESRALFDTNTASSIISESKNLSKLCITIDSLNLPVNISLVKIDVEGYELHVLHGMENLIKRDRPIFIVESNSADISSFFEERGYRKENLNKKSRNDVYFFGQ